MDESYFSSLSEWALLVREKKSLKPLFKNSPVIKKPNQIAFTHCYITVIRFWLQSDHILTTFWLHSDETLTFRLHSDYIRITFWLHSDYFWLHSGYILTIFWLHSGYILVRFWLDSDHILTTFQLHSDYIPTIFRLHSDYILTTSDLPPTRANAYICWKSMGGYSDNLCIFLNAC